MIGETISNYKVLEKLGEGGMGEVYLAEDLKLNRKVALKFLLKEYAADEELRNRFKREAIAAAALNHPNIIGVYEVSEYRSRPFIAMEYVDEGSLREKIGTAGLSVSRIIDIAVQMCEGLVAAHEKGIVHRDVKPENILVGGKGRIILCDFGLAKVKAGAKLTPVGAILGTPEYMSPEQARGEELDHRTDIFTFGVVLYELLTGKLPFQGDNDAVVLNAIINEEPPPVARLNNRISQDLQRIVSRAMAKEKEKRYQRMDDVLRDLMRVKKGNRVDVPHEPTPKMEKNLPSLDEMLDGIKVMSLSKDKDDGYKRIIGIALGRDEPEKAGEIADMLSLTSHKDCAYCDIILYYISKRQYAEALALLNKLSLTSDRDEAAKRIFDAQSKEEKPPA